MAMKITRMREGGSIVNFAIVAVVLAVLVIGGIYTVHKSSQPQPSPSASPKVAKSPAPTNAPSKSTQASPSKTPAISKSPAKTPSVTKTPTTGTAPLPATGPEDNLIHMIMLASLAGVTAAFIQSYRARTEFFGVPSR